jgi:hypothetical protein
VSKDIAHEDWPLPGHLPIHDMVAAFCSRAETCLNTSYGRDAVQ